MLRELETGRREFGLFLELREALYGCDVWVREKSGMSWGGQRGPIAGSKHPISCGKKLGRRSGVGGSLYVGL